ncbi:hypothetical protein BKA93DRAFT_713837, partial [Sparassis latifolia]
DRKKEKNTKYWGNITFDEIARTTMQSKSLARTLLAFKASLLANGVKEILGTAQSIGYTIDGQLTRHDAINSGGIEV